MSKNDRNCAILVNSCDAYSDTWTPFFKLLLKNWHCQDYAIYLNTEKKNYCCDFLSVKTLNCFKEVSWSKRLKLALKRISEDFIFMFLDDFFLQDKVDEKQIETIIYSIKNNSRIVNFSFMAIPSYIPSNPLNSSYKGFYKRESTMRFILTTQVALWRKKDLIALLSNYESPWQFEQYGSIRAKEYPKKEYYICMPKNRIFNYCYKIEDGYGICNGKWLKNTPDLFLRNNIEVDFSNLGFFNGDNPNAIATPPKKSFKWKLHHFVFGGCDAYYMPVSRQIVFMLFHPRTYLRYIINKLRFVLNEDFY